MFVAEMMKLLSKSNIFGLLYPNLTKALSNNQVFVVKILRKCEIVSK